VLVTTPMRWLKARVLEGDGAERLTMLCTWIDRIPDGYASDGRTLVTREFGSEGASGAGVAAVSSPVNAG